MSTFLHQLFWEQRVFWRSREAAVFIFIFPVLLYSLLGSVYGDDIEIDGERYSSSNVLLAGLFGYGAASTGLAGLAIILVLRREAGFLKRLRSTPLSPPVYITAVLVSMLIVFALQSVALVALGTLAFDADLPENPVGFVGAVLLGAACFSGLGVGFASVIRSDEAVAAVVNVVVLPMAFLSGSFGPTQDYPAVLEAIGSVLPLKYFIDITNGVYLEGESLFADPGALAVVAAWGIAGLAVALRRFGWVPRERPA
jgi:ABC-2 type transport system permease protein